MLRSDLKSARSVVKDKFLQIRIGCLVHKPVLIQEKVISDSAADVGMAYSLHGHDLMIHLKDTLMTPVHVWTRGGEKT